MRWKEIIVRTLRCGSHAPSREQRRGRSKSERIYAARTSDLTTIRDFTGTAFTTRENTNADIHPSSLLSPSHSRSDFVVNIRKGKGERLGLKIQASSVRVLSVEPGSRLALSSPDLTLTGAFLLEVNGVSVNPGLVKEQLRDCRGMETVSLRFCFRKLSSSIESTPSELSEMWRLVSGTKRLSEVLLIPDEEDRVSRPGRTEINLDEIRRRSEGMWTINDGDSPSPAIRLRRQS
jgi:hypothetical protein